MSDAKRYPLYIALGALAMTAPKADETHFRNPSLAFGYREGKVRNVVYINQQEHGDKHDNQIIFNAPIAAWLSFVQRSKRIAQGPADKSTRMVNNETVFVNNQKTDQKISYTTEFGKDASGFCYIKMTRGAEQPYKFIFSTEGWIEQFDGDMPMNGTAEESVDAAMGKLNVFEYLVAMNQMAFAEADNAFRKQQAMKNAGYN